MEGRKEKKKERQTLPSASPPRWPAQDLPTPEQSSSGSLVNLRSPGDDTHRSLVESDSRTPVNSQQWGRGRQRRPNHLREHGDGRRPGRHATVLPREALAKLVDGALGHAVANHPWEMGRKRVRDHWPPMVCPQATMPGSRGGREEEKDGHLWREWKGHKHFEYA